jgi:hypothetical protein
VHPQEPSNALAVVACAKRAVHHCPHPTIAVGGAAVGDRADLLEDGLVGEAAIEAGRARAA